MSRQGEGYTYYSCKAKPLRNPIARCNVNSSNINEFNFSPCGELLALVSQDGFLRIFHFDSMELVGTARSYFGGLLCCSWSPDGRYVVVGGEDDLVTVYSLQEKRVVVRGQGHRSWVSAVTFDRYNLAYGDVPDGLDFSGSDEEGTTPHPSINSPSTSHRGLQDQESDRVVRGARSQEGGQDLQRPREGGPDLPPQESPNNVVRNAEDGKRSRKTSVMDDQNVTCYRQGNIILLPAPLRWGGGGVIKK